MAVRTVSPAEVGRLKSAGRPVRMIDVRTPAEFAEVHAEGAELVPLDRLDPKAVASSENGRSDEPLYVLCRSGGRAAKAVERFEAAGFSNVVSVEGGTQAWEQAGLPVVRGAAKAISLERQVRIGAGLLVLLGVALGVLVHPALLGVAAFVGAGLVFAGVTDWCGMGLFLARMPWNRAGGGGAACPR